MDIPEDFFIDFFFEFIEGKEIDETSGEGNENQFESFDEMQELCKKIKESLKRDEEEQK